MNTDCETRQRRKQVAERTKKRSDQSIKSKSTDSTATPKTTKRDDDKNKNDFDAITVDDVKTILHAAGCLIGFCIMICSAYWFSVYISTLHENQMWFTNIQEVEREISFRTESGLYYSYYKQLLKAPSFWEGVRELSIDNATEHGRTINIIQRFNIYPEIILAGVYRASVDFWNRATGGPIFFYVYSIFALNGVYLCTLFGTTWLLTGGSWLAGALCVGFFVMNLDDTTRVFYSINLREAFALPFFFLQSCLTCFYLRRSPAVASYSRDQSSHQRFAAADQALLRCEIGIFLSTLLFSLSWQFNQFFLLLQALTLYGLGILFLAPRRKIYRLLSVNAAALLATCALQTWQPMLLGSLYFSFVPSALLSMYLCSDWRISGGIVGGGLKLIVQAVFTFFVLTIPLNVAVKKLLQIEADEHIFKFMKGKFGFADPRDFESRIYLCHGAFVFLDSDFFVRTSIGGHCLFPLYLITLAGGLFLMGKDILMEWCAPIMPYVRHVPADRSDPTDKPYCFNKRPDLAFFILQSALFGLVAMMALRMKYAWTPHICVLAAFVAADRKLWHDAFRAILPAADGGAGVHQASWWFKWKNRASACWPADVVRHTITAVLLVTLIWRFVPKYKNQMEELREFWDPDTVELMYWIGNNTTPTASFAGSMQLLAGVKCCTGRHVTNHPHFEDKALRDRTRDVYQIYARRQPDEVYQILKSFDTHYIILEDSICLARSDGCRTPDLIDLANGHTPDFLHAAGRTSNGGGGPTDSTEKWLPPGLKRSTLPRFCDEIRRQEGDYGKYFKLVMHNRTFRVYQLI